MGIAGFSRLEAAGLLNMCSLHISVDSSRRPLAGDLQ